MSMVKMNLFLTGLNFRTEVTVVLPEYPQQRNAACPREQAFDPSYKFPAVYLLHGFTGDYTDWSNMLPIERYASKYGLAVVMPHGYNTWYLNVPDGLQMENVIADELPAAMQALLPISADPARRFIAGLSMGGTGAIRIGFKYPERYRAVAAMSALPDPLQPICEGANPQYGETIRKSVQQCYGGEAELLSDEKNPLMIALKRKQEGRTLPPTLYQYGQQDPRYAVQYLTFKKFAEENELPVTFSEQPGGHNFDYWDGAIQEALDWFGSLLNEDKR